MRAATLFSGIGAPECARPDWQWLWHAEIEPFPAAVMQARHPGSLNLGNVLAADFLERATTEPIDVLVGGPPCQAFSVAGLRGGLSDPRGNLSLRWVQVLHAVRPRFAVTENVPGWLNTPDNAFGCFLGALVGADDALSPPPGGGWPRAGMVAGPLMRAAWRVLDARYFNLAQRRERVFVVSCPPDGADPCAILFEPKGGGRHPAPGREAGQGVARPIAASPRGGSGYRNDADTADNLIAGPTAYACQGTNVGEFGALRSGNGHVTGGSPFVTHALRAEGFDASEDGTGPGTPLVPVAWQGGSNQDQFVTPDGVSPTLAFSSCTNGGHYQPKVMMAYGGNNTSGPIDVATALNAHGGPHGRCDFESETFVAQAMNLRGREGGAMPEMADVASLRAASGGSSRSHVAAVHENQRAELTLSDTAGSLKVGGGKPGQGYPTAMQGMQVRRLTPRECARLQGFPDDWCAIQWRGKPAADGPMYRAYGNSMAVPCLKWLLTRIEQQHQFQAEANHAA